MSKRAGSRHAPPRAGAMIEALRGLGYTTATALADIIDNSIAAEATHVELRFVWDGTRSFISILDDGRGMTPGELDHAMRLGDRSPLDTRTPTDLGRFGLGLKTASFSQCRRLTVASRTTKSDVSILRWDLDVLAASDDDGWYMLEGADPESVNRLAPLESKPHGTLVLLELLDRIVTPGFTSQNFLDLMDVVERHLAMVFHRFLDGPRPRFAIILNDRQILPWDPFLLHHPATWSSPVQRLAAASGVVEVQCHVLPHRDRLKPREYEEAGGPEGWTAQQGVYVYRNERLLLAGGWLNLGQGRAWTREESHRLARIRVDIPNTADHEWKIDIRKSMARPPVALRSKLMRLAEDTRARARRVFAHRGQVQRLPGQSEVNEVWEATHSKTGTRYRVSLEHPAVAAVLAEAGELSPSIRAMIRVIEETIPVQRVWLDTAEDKELPRNGFAVAPTDEVREILQTLYRGMLNRKGMSPDLARMRLLATEPFNLYPELVAALPDHA